MSKKNPPAGGETIEYEPEQDSSSFEKTFLELLEMQNQKNACGNCHKEIPKEDHFCSSECFWEWKNLKTTWHARITHHHMVYTWETPLSRLIMFLIPQSQPPYPLMYPQGRPLL